jgi:ankyrin repeat protein
MAAKVAAMEGEKAILKAAKSGDAARVGELLAGDGALVNARDKDGSTPLHCAAWKGHVEVAAVLLDAGADLNARSQNEHYGDTPLHAAAHGNQRAVAELLIARGADARAVSCNGRTPLQETEIHGATAVARLLREHGVGE